MHVIISQIHDHKMIVQVPNDMGGLYPLVSTPDKVFSIQECYRRIGEWVEQHHCADNVTIEFRGVWHPKNSFTERHHLECW